MPAARRLPLPLQRPESWLDAAAGARTGPARTQLAGWAFYAALLEDDTLRAAYVNVGERGETRFMEQPLLGEARDALVHGILSAQIDNQRNRNALLKTEIAKLFKSARVKMLDGSRITDEVEGEFISYDSRAEFYTVNNTATGESKPGGGRVRATLQPRGSEKGKE